jgi:hypothetical protein
MPNANIKQRVHFNSMQSFLGVCNSISVKKTLKADFILLRKRPVLGEYEKDWPVIRVAKLCESG